MASAHEPGEVTHAEVPGGSLAAEVSSQDARTGVDHAGSIMSPAGVRATAGLIAEPREAS